MGSDTERAESIGDASAEQAEKTKQKGKELRPNSIASHEATGDQIPHQEFQAFVDEYFEEIDESVLSSVVAPSSAEDVGKIFDYSEYYERYHDLLVRNLVGCLIVSRDVDVGEADAGSKTEHVEGSVFGDWDQHPFFARHKILECFANKSLGRLIGLYEEQVRVNNKRKKVLEKRLKDRLVYMAYWNSLRVIDAEVDTMLSRAKKLKKRKKLEFDTDSIRHVLDKRERFTGLFRSESLLADDYSRFDDLFDPGENVVPPPEYGIEPLEYFSRDRPHSHGMQ
jgi:hypothetical protein